jgi:hypothetical protein
MAMHKKIIIYIIVLLISESLISCKTSYSIYKEPWKPQGIVFEGNCLVYQLYTELPIKREEEMIKIVLKQLTKIEGVGFNYLKFLNVDSVINGRIEFVPQPDIMDRIGNELNYQYLINVAIYANRYKKSGFAWSALTWVISHQVTAEIAVYETETSRLLYTGEVVLTEELDTVSDDWGDERPRKFQVTYSTEGLLKKAVKKCARDLKQSAKKAIKSEQTESSKYD